MAARAHVVEADLELSEGLDPGAVGAAVTVELCGHWEHDGPCRWPHNSAIDGTRFRTLFVAEEGEAGAVRARIEAVLRGAGAWQVVALRDRPVAEAEHGLAARLLAGPRAPD